MNIIEFDFIVIGGGSAYAVARTAHEHSTVIDERTFGLYPVDMPSKHYLYILHFAGRVLGLIY